MRQRDVRRLRRYFRAIVKPEFQSKWFWREFKKGFKEKQDHFVKAFSAYEKEAKEKREKA